MLTALRVPAAICALRAVALTDTVVKLRVDPVWPVPEPVALARPALRENKMARRTLAAQANFLATAEALAAEATANAVTTTINALLHIVYLGSVATEPATGPVRIAEAVSVNQLSTPWIHADAAVRKCVMARGNAEK